MKQLNICGTIIIALEGINATIAGTEQAMTDMLQKIQSVCNIKLTNIKTSFCAEKPFLRTKVKIKKEIVTMGFLLKNFGDNLAKLVDSEQWNQLLQDPETLVIDTRNNYEISIGTFNNAKPINTNNFREFPKQFEKLNQKYQPKKVAMFCTGGIRCEKAGAYVKSQGVDKVYQLSGGILKYLDDYKTSLKDNQWLGECFVFDDRVSVDKQLQRGQSQQCFACRMPLSQQDIAHQYYQKGISCPHCFHQTTAKQRARFSERQKQIRLVGKEQHLG